MIKLTKITKRTKEMSSFSFDNLKQLEKYIAKIKPNYLESNDYTITSDDFRDLKDFFNIQYKQSFFKIDEEFEAIHIFKMQRNGKRKKRGKSSKDRLKYLMKTLVHYFDEIEFNEMIEEEQCIRIFTEDGDEFVFNYNDNFTEIKTITINGMDLDRYINLTSQARKFRLRLNATKK